MKVLFNPKVFKNELGDTVKSTDIKHYPWSHLIWSLKVNEIRKFPDEVADALLNAFSFLIEVTPKNITKIKAEMLEKQFKCSECGFQTDTKLALAGHMRSHGVSPETKALLDGIEEAEPTSKYKEAVPQKKMSIEEQEGITKGTDKDGVEWYGPGEEKDEDTRPLSRRKPGDF